MSAGWTGPTESAARIDAARYTSVTFMRREWGSMWPRVWWMAAHASDLPDAGAWLCVDLGPESILLVRQDDGSLRAFHNACPHRGTPLCDAGSGQAEQFRCPYHAWTFSRAGALVAMPDRERFAAASMHGAPALTPVACEAYGGLVWIHLDPNARGVGDYLGEVGEHLRAYRVGEWARTQDLSVDLACNWKTGVDAHNETYHVHLLHPETLALLDDTAARVDCYARHARIQVPFGAPSRRLDARQAPPALARWAAHAGVDAASFGERFGELRVAVQRALRSRAAERGVDLAGLTDAQLTDTHQLYIFPNLQLNLRAEEMLLFRHRPHAEDPQRCVFDQQSYARVAPGAASRPRTAHAVRSAGKAELGPVTAADVAMTERQQRGLRSRGFRGPTLGEQEVCIRHMHRVLDGYLDGSG